MLLGRRQRQVAQRHRPAWPRAAAIWWNDAESFSLSYQLLYGRKGRFISRGLVRIVTPPEDFVVCKPPAPSSLCAAAVFSSDFPRPSPLCLAVLYCRAPRCLDLRRTSSGSPLQVRRVAAVIAATAVESAAPSFDDMTPRGKVNFTDSPEITSSVRLVVVVVGRRRGAVVASRR